VFFFNLSTVEFFALFTAISGLVVALYLLDRSKRKQTVPTLRFWVAAEQPPVTRHRRRIQQPLSLLLQILSIACLLAALAQLRWGDPERASRDHVLILDTSSWMSARAPQGTLMEEARKAAQAYLRALPATDRVMLVRADALATPATALESNRQILETAIRQSEPGPTALNLDQAFAFARQFQRLHTHGGEVVYVGAGRIADGDSVSFASTPENLRVIAVDRPVENCGLRKIGLRRSPNDPAVWDVFVAVRNYGRTPRTLPFLLRFGGAPVASRQVTLAPLSEQNISLQFRTRAAGWLEARLLSKDGFPEDDRAILEIPAQTIPKVVVYSDEPDLLRPVLSANPRVEASFLRPSEYSADAPAHIVILDRFRPKVLPKVATVLIEPPRDGSPIPVKTVAQGVALSRWHGENPLGAGLHAKTLQLESTQVYLAAPSDIPVAEVDAGPAILARPGNPRMVALGFHPVRSAMRYELTTPLLFANILRWLEPDIFRRWELNAGSVGTVNLALDTDVDPSQVKVLAENGKPLPYTLRDRNLRFFSGMPGTVRVVAGDKEVVYSLTLPEVADTAWAIPQAAKRGIPSASALGPASWDLWPWLAVLGAIGLAVEWMLFGRHRRGVAVSRPGGRLLTWARARASRQNGRTMRRAS
jgi:hypothetical protein